MLCARKKGQQDTRLLSKNLTVSRGIGPQPPGMSPLKLKSGHATPLSRGSHAPQSKGQGPCHGLHPPPASPPRSQHGLGGHSRRGVVPPSPGSHLPLSEMLSLMCQHGSLLPSFKALSLRPAWSPDYECCLPDGRALLAQPPPSYPVPCFSILFHSCLPSTSTEASGSSRSALDVLLLFHPALLD